MTPETDLILRALDDLRDDLNALRGETRQDFAIAFARLDETRLLVARIDERSKPDDAPADSVRPKRKAVKDFAVANAPAAGVSAVVVTLVELVPEILKAITK